jgi:hypothetical protein
MRKHITVVALVVFAATMAMAQSSGNASWGIDQTQCAISCGANDPSCTSTVFPGFNNTGVAKVVTTIQTPSSGSTSLIIRPSAVTGLYTNTNVTKLSSFAAANAQVTATVKMDGEPIPGLSTVVYDQRLQQLSTNIFTNVGQYCGTDPITGVLIPCNFDMIQATLSAHSYDFVVQNPNANGTNNHTIEVDFAIQNPASSNSSAGACVGPVTLTVEQVKAFQQDFSK